MQVQLADNDFTMSDKQLEPMEVWFKGLIRTSNRLQSDFLAAVVAFLSDAGEDCMRGRGGVCARVLLQCDGRSSPDP